MGGGKLFFVMAFPFSENEMPLKLFGLGVSFGFGFSFVLLPSPKISETWTPGRDGWSVWGGESRWGNHGPNKKKRKNKKNNS